jgi:hypothetical protein
MPADRRETLEQRRERVAREISELWGMVSDLRVAFGESPLRYDPLTREVVGLESPTLTLIPGGRDDA